MARLSKTHCVLAAGLEKSPLAASPLERYPVQVCLVESPSSRGSRGTDEMKTKEGGRKGKKQRRGQQARDPSGSRI